MTVSRRFWPDHRHTVRPPTRRPPLPLLYAVLGVPLAIAALADLPRIVQLGPVSGMGALSIFQVLLIGAAVLACKSYPALLLKRLTPYYLFLSWVGLTCLWARPDMPGFQNGMLYLLFGLLMLLSGTLTARNPAAARLVIDRGVTVITCVALLLVAVDLTVHGWSKDPAAQWWIGPRPVAILGVVVMCRHLASWYYGNGRAKLSIALWLGAIVATISRAATGIGLVLIALVVLAQMRFRLRRAILTFPTLVAVGTVVACLALFWTPLHDHMFGGDAKLQVGATRINVSGRWTMWSAIISSAMNHPLIGGGLGSAVRVITDVFSDSPSQMTQPHDDYLRLWHDTGFIGLILYLLGVGIAVKTLFGQWYENEQSGAGAAELEFTGLLAVAAICAFALTDNPFVYPSVMATAGVLIGAGLGARAYEADDRRLAARRLPLRSNLPLEATHSR